MNRFYPKEKITIQSSRKLCSCLEEYFNEKLLKDPPTSQHSYFPTYPRNHDNLFNNEKCYFGRLNILGPKRLNLSTNQNIYRLYFGFYYK